MNPHNTLRIAQWNSRSIVTRIPELTYHANNLDIFIIAETWLTPEIQVQIKGFDVVRQDRVGRQGGGVLILIRNSLKYRQMMVMNNCQGRLEVCAIQLFTSLGTLNIVSVYRPPSNSTINYREWSSFLTQFQGLTLLGGDFNLHDDPRTTLVEAMTDLDYVLLNSEEPTHYDLANNTESSIDLTIISSTIALLSKWEVTSDLWGSDHYPILYI